MGIAEEAKKRALWAVQKAAAKLLEDERRAKQIARAVGLLQQGKQQLEGGRDQLLHLLSVMSPKDLREVQTQVAGLRRRLRSLEAKLKALGKKE